MLLTLDIDTTPQHLAESLGDRETEADPTVIACIAHVGLLERLEDELLAVPRYADPIVRHGDRQEVGSMLDIDVDLTVLREFGGIGDQVEPDVEDLSLVDGDMRLAGDIAMGWITSRLQERLHDQMLELAMSLTTPFATSGCVSPCRSRASSGWSPSDSIDRGGHIRAPRRLRA